MSRLLLVGLVLFILLGSMAVVQVRTRMGGTRLGSDVIYTLDERGNAAVQMVEKTYFVDAETEKNFDGLVARMGQPDAGRFGNGIRESVKKLGEKIGRPQMEVSGFQARFQREAEYGARLYSFNWTAFAERREGSWVVDFRAADGVKLTKDSSLTVLLPAGSVLVTAVPPPSALDGRKLVWTGAREIPWPYLEYR